MPDKIIYMPSWRFVMAHHSKKPDGEVLDATGIFKYHTSYRIDFKIVSRDEYQDRLLRNEGVVFQPRWSDVGYNFLVEQVLGFYHIIVGRPMTKRGAHCPHGGMNHRAVSICYVGDYDEIEPPTEMLEVSAKRIIVPVMAMRRIPLENIVGHRDYNKTKTCPGEKFDLALFREIIKKYM